MLMNAGATCKQRRKSELIFKRKLRTPCTQNQSLLRVHICWMYCLTSASRRVLKFCVSTRTCEHVNSHRFIFQYIELVECDDPKMDFNTLLQKADSNKMLDEIVHLALHDNGELKPPPQLNRKTIFTMENIARERKLVSKRIESITNKSSN